jgi:hypothetical protein
MNPSDVALVYALTHTTHIDAASPIGDKLRDTCEALGAGSLGQMSELTKTQLLNAIGECRYAVAVVNLGNNLLRRYQLPEMRP